MNNRIAVFISALFMLFNLDLASAGNLSLSIDDLRVLEFNLKNDELRLVGVSQSKTNYLDFEVDAIYPKKIFGSDTGADAVRETGTGSGIGIGPGNAPEPIDIIHEWGKAEVLLRCGEADIVLSQWIGDKLIEVLATSIRTEYCF